MRIAVVGAGISGIGAALALSCQAGHKVVIFDKDSRPGGHSATVDIDHEKLGPVDADGQWSKFIK